MRPAAKGALAAVLASVLGCSVLVDTSDLDAGCPAGTKLCAGSGCVDIEDPAYGCKLDSCIPCTEVENAVAVCSNLECQAECLEGFGCAGCTVNLLTSEENCGACCLPGDEPCPNRCAEGMVCKEGTCVEPLGQ